MATGKRRTPKASSAKPTRSAKPTKPAKPAKRAKSTLELVSVDVPDFKARDLANVQERLVALLGDGEWRVATQSRDLDQPLVAYGRRSPNHLAHGYTIYRLDETATHATEVGHYYGSGHPPCDVVLLPKARLAILTPNKLMLAITEPALQVIDELPLEAGTCMPVLDGEALLLDGYREISRTKMETITIALGIYNTTLLELGRIEESERFFFRTVGDRTFAGGNEVVDFAQLHATKRDTALARRAAMPARRTAPIRLLPFAGITEVRSAEPALPEPPCDEQAAALLPDDAWVGARYHGYTCIELKEEDGVELALVEAATKRIIHMSPEVRATHNYFVTTRFAQGTLLLAADTDAYEVELVSGRATRFATGDTDVQHLGYAGDLIAIIRFAPSTASTTYFLEWHRGGTVISSSPIAAERLTTLCDGSVLVAHSINFSIPSWFFAVDGHEFRLLGFTRAIKQLWERDGRCFYETALGDVYELTGLARAAKHCMVAAAAPIDLGNPCVPDVAGMSL